MSGRDRENTLQLYGKIKNTLRRTVGHLKANNYSTSRVLGGYLCKLIELLENYIIIFCIGSILAVWIFLLLDFLTKYDFGGIITSVTRYLK